MSVKGLTANDYSHQFTKTANDGKNRLEFIERLFGVDSPPTPPIILYKTLVDCSHI